MHTRNPLPDMITCQTLGIEDQAQVYKGGRNREGNVPLGLQAIACDRRARSTSPPPPPGRGKVRAYAPRTGPSDTHTDQLGLNYVVVWSPTRQSTNSFDVQLFWSTS